MFATPLVNLYTHDIEARIAFDAAYLKLVAAGVPAVQPPHDSSNNNRSALLRDPDGNLVEIVAKRS